ncbi:integrase catalytic domain-containing protein, partial [Nephila pilipes]
MATDENVNKLQRKRSTLRSKVTRLTGKLNDVDGIDKAFDVELLEDTLQDLKLMNETIHDLLNDEDYERDTVDCEKYFDTAKLAIFNTKRKVSANINVSSSEFSPPSKDKYGNKDRIIQSHLDYFENLKPVQDPSPMELNDLHIECNRRLQALNALGENTEAYGRILAPKIIRAFPTEICCRWIIYAKREKLAEGNITRLMQFLAEEVEGSVEAQKIRGTLSPDNILKSSVENFNIDLKLVNKNKKISPFCAFCNTSGHWPQNCETVTDYKTRVQKLNNSNRCFLCTNRGHRITNCPRKSTARCIKCKKQHHVSICPPRNTQLLITHSEVNHINIPRTILTYLQTACLYVTGPTGITKLTRCILDGGSQVSFVDVKLIDKLKLNVINSSSLGVQAFESPFTQEQRRCVQLTLSGLWSKQLILITAFESNNTYTIHPAATLEISQFAHKNKLKLADPPDNSSLPIELLIGGDYYWQIVTAESPIKLSDSFVMVPSMLGWILSGSRTHTTIADNTFVHQFSVQVSNDCLNDQVRCFWELDSIGIQDIQKRRMSARDEEILSKFHKDYKTEDNRRIVSLTWKSTVTPLSPNIVNAKNRFHSLQKRLSSSNVLKTQYYKYEIAVYRFSRLPFGLTCSPFLLCASTRELAMKHISEFPIAASMIDKHLYMDDFLASTETETHITMLYHEVTDLMTLMKLPMEKWATNSLKLKDVIQTNKEFRKSTTDVLGIDWDTNDDTLGNAFKTSFCVAGGKPLTKRWLLRCIASCYDPLGLFSPFTIRGKILFQDTWILGIKWDELLPTNLSTMWYAAVKQLDDICSIKISRYIGISSHTPYSVHVFWDASERAYGSVLYIVTSQSNVQIVCSRNRLAPIKKVTLPRLELLAALMGTRLLKYFCKEVDIQPSAATLWTDSKITLSWIRSNPNKWKTFVCTRTTEILQYTRALHLELVSDLSTDKVLLALQQFVGRRGLPCTIYTDNATTFHAANKELIHLWKVITSGKIQQFYAHNGIHWKFIVPRAAWWGGWGERLIGLTKRCLRKAIGHALLDIE